MDAPERKIVMGKIGRYVAQLPWGAEEVAEDRPGQAIRMEVSGTTRTDVRMRLARLEKPERAQAERELARVLPKDAVDALLAGEERLFAWLAAKSTRPALFVTDPLSCLAQAKVKLPPRALEMLARHRDDQRRMADPSVLGDIHRLTVDLASRKKNEGKTGDKKTSKKREK
jgi:hypothetical protein